MTLRLYNSLSCQKEDFVPLIPNKVSLYLCGPTVYDRAHIGNARPVVVFDVLVRLLGVLGYDVTYVRNITDIDDKIMKRAQELDQSIGDLTKITTAYYHEDMAALGAHAPTHEPRATEYVQGMINHIQGLIDKDMAYEAQGHVLFHVASFPSYGALSGCQGDEILAGARVEVAPFKKNPQDFVLWKPSTPDQPGWDSPWGWGRPGWHIECSAMSDALLGKTFDIHGGGQDLKFPHHENERAQSLGLHGPDTFARYWVHNGPLTVQGEKMSKSLGNTVTVHDMRNQTAGEVIRLALLSAHYRQPLDWTHGTIERCQSILNRLYRAVEGMPTPSLFSKDPHALISPDVLAALKDDLNVPLALTHLQALAKKIHENPKAGDKTAWQESLKASAWLLGLLEKTPQEWFQEASGKSSLTPGEIEAMIHGRNQARKDRDFQKADMIRQKLLDHGVMLEDTAQGTTWRLK